MRLEGLEIVVHGVHKHFLRCAYRVAEECSTDPRTRVGAVLVKKKTNLRWLVSSGANQLRQDAVSGDYNRTLEQLRVLCEDSEFKKRNIVHAEINAIEDAKNRNTQTKELIMYMPWLPCVPCAKAMVDVGITELTGHKECIERTDERWSDNLEEAIRVLKEGGVSVNVYSGRVGGVINAFNGELWHP